jgi:hypothetical protein
MTMNEDGDVISDKSSISRLSEDDSATITSVLQENTVNLNVKKNKESDEDDQLQAEQETASIEEGVDTVQGQTKENEAENVPVQDVGDQKDQTLDLTVEDVKQTCDKGSEQDVVRTDPKEEQVSEHEVVSAAQSPDSVTEVVEEMTETIVEDTEVARLKQRIQQLEMQLERLRSVCKTDG